MLLGCIALTIIILAGLPKIGGHPLESYLPKKLPLGILSVQAVEVPVPQPPKRTASVFSQELTMPTSELINRWDPFVAEASRKFGVSEAWIKAVMRVETGGRTVQAGDHPITSRAGAMGLMQLMHGTYNEMRAQYGLGADPFNPRDNVFAAAGYLHWLYKRYGFPNMFAAYNGGPGKLEDHLSNGAPLPDETVNYIASVTRIVGAPEQTTVARADGGRHHRNLRAYASLMPRRGRRVTATLGG